MATTISGTSGITTPAETLGPAGLTFGDSTVQTTAATSPVAPVVTIYSSPATWTKSAILKAVKITLVAGGGSGGSTSAPAYTGGAGGNGGILYGYAQSPVIPGPVTVTVGAGGPAPAINVAGASGGTSSFGSVFSTTGGGGGSGGSGVPTGPGASGGAYSITSTPTSSSLQLTSPITTAVMAYGVHGLTPGASPSTGTAGTGYGMGGGGSIIGAGGAAGTAGFVIVEEFY